MILVRKFINHSSIYFGKLQESFSRIPKDFRYTVFCAALRHGGVEEWEFLWDRYKKSNVGAEKATILASLGCTREIWLLSRFVSFLKDLKPGKRIRDSVINCSCVVDWMR